MAHRFSVLEGFKKAMAQNLPLNCESIQKRRRLCTNTLSLRRMKHLKSIKKSRARVDAFSGYGAFAFGG